MSNEQERKFKNGVAFAVGLILGAILAVSCSPAHASGDRITQSNDNNAQTTGDVNVAGPTIGGDSSRAFAVGTVLGDVDIADCLGSTQWSTPVFGKQKLVLNHVCMAEFYLRAGKYELAAMALCNVKEIRKEFDDEAACEAAHDFTPPPAPAPVVAPTAVEEIELEQDAQDEDIAQVRIEQQTLLARVEALEARPVPKPRAVLPAPPKPAFTAEQKRRALAALRGDDDE